MKMLYLKQIVLNFLIHDQNAKQKFSPYLNSMYKIAN